ncbi:MAG: hypothetical protein Q4Q18_07630 [Methanobrevibacter sp.]|nr:hypothetical protein [Methanobrevibacter sp.]
MKFHYKIKNQKLYEIVEKKAKELHTTIDELIWGYINRGLVDDAFDEDIFNKLHSKKYLSEIDEALGLD